MCGVVGALGDSAQYVEEAVGLLAHRGIRSTIREVPSGRVGHVRLPIVGLGEENDQPILHEGGRLMGFVGEILDFKETHPHLDCDVHLAAELMFSTAESSVSPFKDRDGFWGILFIDEDMLYVTTDYLGQKPMYYRTDVPAAASEPAALKAFGPVTLDEVYLSACIKWGYCPDVERTPYNEVKHVLPGELVALTYVVWDGSSVAFRQIVDPLVPYTSNDRSIRDEIELAVERRVLSSDVPVACLLSGGLDSSIVYTLAKKHGKIIPYYVSDGKLRRDEDPDFIRAYLLSRSYPTVTVGPELTLPPTIEENLRQAFWSDVDWKDALQIMQEPIDLGSLVPQVSLSKTVQERVCLTGDGADEMFGGYGRYMRYDSQYSDVFQELPAWHLPRLDRVMMRNRIEVRSPFLARRVAQMALGLPHHLRQNKLLLRQLFSDILPASIAQAEKKPLRTGKVEQNREQHSKELVNMFRRMHAQG